MGKKVYAKCALCLQHGELQNSHYMPAALYKIVSGDKGGKSVSNLQNSKILTFTPKQLSKHLLCSECEGKFDKHGEKTVISECYNILKQKFILLSKANNCRSTDYNNNSWLEDVRSNKIDSDKYLYFVLSLIWRMSVVKWADDMPRNILKDEIQEMLRIYYKMIPKSFII